MKRGTLIIITIITYLIVMVAMFLGVQKHIEEKNSRLFGDIHDKVSAIFDGKNQLIDVAYSGYKVNSEKINIPKKPEKYSLKLDDWKEYYGDLYKMYRVHYKRSDWRSSFSCEDGWNLVTLKYDGEGVYQQWIFPYAVGFKKQEYDWAYSYAPSVEGAVDEAFEFYTTDPKSSYYDDFDKGSVNRAWSKIYDASNEYYHMVEDEHNRFYISVFNDLFEQPIAFSSDESSKSPIQKGYMHNGYYRVYIAATQPKTYTIKMRPGNPDKEEMKDLWLYWSIGLTLLLLVVIIPLSIIERKHIKEKDETLYDKLMRLCNPANFISKSNYAKEMVDKANEIYGKLISISPDDKEALNEIQIIAVKELGINLINPDKLTELMDKVNPKRFINPYNPDKLALANELYSILTKEGLTYNELEEVEERSKGL